MATTKTYTFVNGQPADATQVNKNFDDLLAGINAFSYSEEAWTPVLNNFISHGVGPVVVGISRAIGKLMFIECVIYAGAGGNTDVATDSTSYISGCVAPIYRAACTATNDFHGDLGIGGIFSDGIHPPVMSAQTNNIYITAVYVVD